MIRYIHSKVPYIAREDSSAKWKASSRVLEEE